MSEFIVLDVGTTSMKVITQHDHVHHINGFCHKNRDGPLCQGSAT